MQCNNRRQCRKSYVFSRVGYNSVQRGRIYNYSHKNLRGSFNEIIAENTSQINIGTTLPRHILNFDNSRIPHSCAFQWRDLTF